MEGITLFACQNGHPVAPALPPIPSIIDKAKGLPSFKTQMVFHTSVPATSLSPQCIVFARALLLNNYLDGHPQMQLSLLYLTSLVLRVCQQQTAIHLNAYLPTGPFTYHFLGEGEEEEEGKGWEWGPVHQVKPECPLGTPPKMQQ